MGRRSAACSTFRSPERCLDYRPLQRAKLKSVDTGLRLEEERQFIRRDRLGVIQSLRLIEFAPVKAQVKLQRGVDGERRVLGGERSAIAPAQIRSNGNAGGVKGALRVHGRRHAGGEPRLEGLIGSGEHIQPGPVAGAHGVVVVRIALAIEQRPHVLSAERSDQADAHLRRVRWSCGRRGGNDGAVGIHRRAGRCEDRAQRQAKSHPTAPATPRRRKRLRPVDHCWQP